jgi:transcriptional regulator with XRE-family HTH domain
MYLARILGRNVRTLRKAQGLTQEGLAFSTDMKRSYLSDLERGTRNPSLKAVERLAAVLGVPAHELLRPPE